jgi:hypothetical protein
VPVLFTLSCAVGALLGTSLWASSVTEAQVEPTDDADIREATPQDEYGPFFEGPAPSDSAFPTQARRTRFPVLSVGQGRLCFVEGSHCKVSVILDAAVGAGMRIPASDEGPDIPYAQFTFRGGLAIRPLMLGRRDWHPWGVGVVGSWSRGTGAVTVRGNFENQEVAQTQSTDAVRIAALNQLWLGKKPYALHLDFSMGAVRSPVMTSGIPLWGTHAEAAIGWGGWAALFASGDFLDRDTRVVFGFRGHGIAAGPVIAMALAGLALGGAL